MSEAEQHNQKPTLITQMEHLLAYAEDEIRSGRAYDDPLEYQQLRVQFIVADAICAAYATGGEKLVREVLADADGTRGPEQAGKYHAALASEHSTQNMLSRSIALLNKQKQAHDANLHLQNEAGTDDKVMLSRRELLRVAIPAAYVVAGGVGGWKAASLVEHKRTGQPASFAEKVGFASVGGIVGHKMGKRVVKDLPASIFEMGVNADEFATIAEYFNQIYNGGLKTDAAQQAARTVDESIAGLRDSIPALPDNARLNHYARVMEEVLEDYEAAHKTPFVSPEETIGTCNRLQKDLVEMAKAIHDAYQAEMLEQDEAMALSTGMLHLSEAVQAYSAALSGRAQGRS